MFSQQPQSFVSSHIDSQGSMRHLLFASELYALPVLRPIAKAAIKRGDDVRVFVPSRLVRYLQSGEQRLTNARAVREWRPDSVISASNWVPHFFPGLKVQVFHGFNVDKRSESRGHFRIRGLFDLYCTQGPSTTAPFQAMQRTLGHFRVMETGWSKLDPLFGGDVPLPMLAAARGRTVVGYASTFTASLSSAALLYNTIAEHVARGDRYWLLTLHPKSAPFWRNRYRALAGPNARYVDADELVPMLATADVLVSDTSSVVSEFAVIGKPVVTFRNRAPKPYMIDIHDAGELEAALQRALADDAAQREAVASIGDAIHPYRDGRSSERVLDAIGSVIEDRSTARRRKPASLARRLKIRWRLRDFSRAG